MVCPCVGDNQFSGAATTIQQAAQQRRTTPGNAFVRLHWAIGYVTPADKLAGLEQVIFTERDRKLEEARLSRQQARQALREVAG